MASDDPRYVKINEFWANAPKVPCTTEDAARMVKAICDEFGLRSLGGPNMRRKFVTRKVRRVWTNKAPKGGHVENGYNRLAHDLSHMINRRRHPSFPSHDNTQAKLEWEISCFVVAMLLNM